jgi:hypothetical protein
MVQRIGIDDDAGDLGGQRAERRPVRDIARGEDQRRRLAVQVGQLALQLHVVMVGAGDVARAARPGAAFVDRLVHRGNHLLVLAHAQIVVRAPDRHILRRAILAVPRRLRKLPRMTLQIRKHTVIARIAQRAKPIREELVKMHSVFPICLETMR